MSLKTKLTIVEITGGSYEDYVVVHDVAYRLRNQEDAVAAEHHQVFFNGDIWVNTKDSDKTIRLRRGVIYNELKLDFDLMGSEVFLDTKPKELDVDISDWNDGVQTLVDGCGKPILQTTVDTMFKVLQQLELNEPNRELKNASDYFTHLHQGATNDLVVLVENIQ